MAATKQGGKYINVKCTINSCVLLDTIMYY